MTAESVPQDSLPRIPGKVWTGMTAIAVVVALVLAWQGTRLVGEFVERQREQAPLATDVATTVRTIEARRVSKDVITRSTGFLRSPSTVKVASETAGKLLEILAREGALVEKGDVLARMDDVVLRSRLEAARARRTGLEANRDYLRRELERVKNLVAEQSLGAAEEDRLSSELQATEANLAASQAALAEAEIFLERCEIRAPAGGVWFRETARAGEYLQPGAPVGLLRSLDPLELEVEVGAIARLGLASGGPVRVELLDVDPTLHRRERWVEECTIADLPAGADEVSRRFPVVVDVPNPDLGLVPGLFARVTFTLPRQERLLLVPKEAVFDRFGKTSVYVVDGVRGESTAAVRALDVRAAADIPSHWIVLDGLAEGDRIIVYPLEQVAPGIAVAPEDLP